MGLQTTDHLTVFPDVWMPETIEEAWELKKSEQGAVFIAGGTIIQMQREQGVSRPSYLISLEKMEHLKEIRERDSQIEIGSLCQLSDCMGATAVKQNVPLLAKAISSIGAPAVRNRGTLGGNLAYRKGDAIPAMLALDAQAILYTDKGYECIPVAEYLANVEPSILLAVRFHKRNAKAKLMLEKVGRREAFTPALVTIAGLVEREEGFVKQVKLAVGGGELFPQRLMEVEDIITGSPLTEQLLTKAYVQIKKAGVISSTPFATEDYVRSMLANLVVSALEDFMNEGD